mmetsp:Transcript_37058/g.75014  ORF Transcript_37058/g.75014 Transcript_37058/m.75014 type:complete len:487 (-) Transcript_37058:1143-2603(-)
MKPHQNNQKFSLVFYDPLVKNTQGKKLLNNKAKILDEKIYKKTGLFFLIRQRIGFSFSKGFRSNLRLGIIQITGCLLLKFTRLFFLELNFEIKEQFRKDFVHYSGFFLKNNMQKKNRDPKKRIMIMISNQTNFIKFLKVFLIFFKSETFAAPRKPKKNGLFNKDWERLLYGKMLKPADCRNFHSEGFVDSIKIGGFLEKKVFKLTKEIKKGDLIFLSPLAFRKLSSEFCEKLIFSVKFCFLDNFEVMVMQNLENLLSILKYFLLKNNLHSRNGTFFPPKKRVPSFKIFIATLLPFLEKLKIFKNLAITRFIFLFQFSERRKFRCIPFPKVFFLNFSRKKNIDEEIQRLRFFKKELFFFLKSQTKNSLSVFVRSYSQYTLVRNFLMENETLLGVKILCFSEYCDFSEIKKKKNMVKKNHKRIILITERFFFFYRYSFDHSSAFIFYSAPINFELFFELINCKKEKCLKKIIIVCFNNWEIKSLKRIN